MIGIVKKYRDFQSRRQQRGLERWAETREKGKARFVLRQAVIFPATMTALNDFYGYIFDGGVPTLRIRFIVWWLVVGIIAGFPAWSTREREYRKALTSRGQALADNNIVLD